MLQKTRQPKHGGYKSILERWHKDDKYRSSLSLIGWTEEQIVEQDKIALEDHSFVVSLTFFKIPNIGCSGRIKTVLNNH